MARTQGRRRRMNLGTKDDLRVQLRRGAAAVAAARVAIGVLALARPGVPSRPWVGVGAGAEEGTAGLAARVLGARSADVTSPWASARWRPSLRRTANPRPRGSPLARSATPW